MLNLRVVTWSLAIWAAIMFVSCVVYGLLTPSTPHMSAFLEQMLPGYESRTWVGFFVGLIQSFLYGAFAGLVYVPVYNFVDRNLFLAKANILSNPSGTTRSSSDSHPC